MKGDFNTAHNVAALRTLARTKRGPTGSVWEQFRGRQISSLLGVVAATPAEVELAFLFGEVP